MNDYTELCKRLRGSPDSSRHTLVDIRHRAADVIEKLCGDLNVAQLQASVKLCTECPRTKELDTLRAEVARLASSILTAKVI